VPDARAHWPPQGPADARRRPIVRSMGRATRSARRLQERWSVHRERTAPMGLAVTSGRTGREKRCLRLKRGSWGPGSTSIISRRPTGAWRCADAAAPLPTGRREAIPRASTNWCARISGSTHNLDSTGSRGRETASIARGALVPRIRPAPAARPGRRVARGDPPIRRELRPLFTQSSYGGPLQFTADPYRCTQRQLPKRKGAIRGQDARTCPTARRVAGGHTLGAATVSANVTGPSEV
jgi:hypothetical protein